MLGIHHDRIHRSTSGHRLASIACVGLLILLFATTAHAGMPTFTLSDLAAGRLSAISFFLVLLLLVTVGVQALWNILRRDIKRLPYLNFKRALALVVLLALLFDVVLLMIAGSREIMTPEAWEKKGTTYQLRDADGATRTTTGADD